MGRISKRELTPGSPLSVWSLCYPCSQYCNRESLTHPVIFSSMPSSKSFTVLALMIESLIHAELLLYVV